jgi:malonate decarboxylase gamma subunit
MNLTSVLDCLFPAGHSVLEHDGRLAGSGSTNKATVAVLGTTNAASISHKIALGLADSILQIIETQPHQAIVFLVDTQGQALARSEELLCLNGSLAHLAGCVNLARRLGHPTVSIVTGEAVSGGFLSFGLMADRVYALSSAQLRVMDLKAMARITKLPYETLVQLAKDRPVFAPGAENYERMGAVEALWSEPNSALLDTALDELNHCGAASDLRMTAGLQRGGRALARTIATAVLAE